MIKDVDKGLLVKVYEVIMYYTVHIFVLLEKFKQNPVKCPLAPLAHEPRPLYRATILKFPGTICVDHNAKTLEASKMSSLLK